MLSRRALIGAAAALAAGPIRGAPAADAVATLGPRAERGWWAIDLATGRTGGENPDLRLPMCSSFKWLLAAMLLARVDAGAERLDSAVAFGPRDLVYNSPTVAAALAAAGGTRATLPVAALCEATVTLSDSAAANLLLARVGGPAALTAWVRGIGDPATRLDRYELALNRVAPGDARDTTTARAMAGDLRRLLYGGGLAPASRDRLLGWLLAAKPGATRMPAGLPPGWRIGHKTGTWRVDPGHGPDERDACGDVAVLLPPAGAPVLIAAYTAGSDRSQAEVDRWFAGLVATVSSPGWRGLRGAGT